LKENVIDIHWLSKFNSTRIDLLWFEYYCDQYK